MEWKRRRTEEWKSQQEEQATLEHRKQVEAETEAARKLAAARAEEAEGRIIAERKNSADAVRASEAAERWAKASRERERRRAEIYAINAVMRWGHVFFVFSCLELTEENCRHVHSQGDGHSDVQLLLSLYILRCCDKQGTYRWANRRVPKFLLRVWA